MHQGPTRLRASLPSAEEPPWNLWPRPMRCRGWRQTGALWRLGQRTARGQGTTHSPCAGHVRGEGGGVEVGAAGHGRGVVPHDPVLDLVRSGSGSGSGVRVRARSVGRKPQSRRPHPSLHADSTRPPRRRDGCAARTRPPPRTPPPPAAARALHVHSRAALRAALRLLRAARAPPPLLLLSSSCSHEPEQHQCGMLAPGCRDCRPRPTHQQAHATPSSAW